MCASLLRARATSALSTPSIIRSLQRSGVEKTISIGKKINYIHSLKFSNKSHRNDDRVKLCISRQPPPNVNFQAPLYSSTGAPSAYAVAQK